MEKGSATNYATENLTGNNGDYFLNWLNIVNNNQPTSLMW